MGLNISLRQEVTFETQPGIRIPCTVYRAGPTGGDYGNGALVAFSDDGREASDALGAQTADGKPDRTHLSAKGQMEIGAIAAREFIRLR